MDLAGSDSATYGIHNCRVGMVTLAEGGQPAAVLSLEHALDTDVSRCGERSGGETAAGGEAVLHALDHRFELRRHEPAGLRRRYAKGVLEPGSIQSIEASCGGGWQRTNTVPECQPRESISRPPNAGPTRGPVS